MNKVALSVALATALATGAAWAQDKEETADSSGCGVGTILFDGQRGPAPQVLAVTTNGTFTQTFSVTTGTMGCNSDGVVNPPTEVRMIVVSSLDGLARDTARGSGETLDSLAQAMAIEPADRPLFFATMRGNFARIFPSENVDAQEVWTHIYAVMVEDETLSRYV